MNQLPSIKSFEQYLTKNFSNELNNHSQSQTAHFSSNFSDFKNLEKLTNPFPNNIYLTFYIHKFIKDTKALSKEPYVLRNNINTTIMHTIQTNSRYEQKLTCNPLFNQLPTKIYHDKFISDSRPIISCSYSGCNRIFKHELFLKKHLITHENIKKPLTYKGYKKSFNDEKQYIQKKKAPHKNRERFFICRMCSKSFTRSDNRLRHEKTIHL